MLRKERLIATASLGALLVLAIYLALISAGRPLCCADDASFAVVSKNLAQGKGYLLTLNYFGANQPFREFDPGLGNGPTSILPVALAIRVLGPSAQLPGLVHVLLHVSMLGALIALLWRPMGAARAAGAVFLFAAASVALSTFHIEHWTAQLGEVIAVLLVLLGAVLAFAQPPSIWRWGTAGACFALGILAKLIAVFLCAGLVLVLVMRMVAAPLPMKSAGMGINKLSAAVALVLGFLMPLGMFELWRFVELGSVQAYLRNVGDYVVFVRNQGLGERSGLLFSQVTDRDRVLSERFGVSWQVVVLSTLLAGVLSRRAPPAVRWLVAGVLCAALSHLAYWFVASNGWPRYALIALLAWLFGLAVTISTCRGWTLALGIAVGLVAIGPSLPRLGYQFNMAHEGLHPTSTLLVTQRQVVHLIEQQTRSRVFIQWWAPAAPLEYLSRQAGRFEVLDTGKLPGLNNALLVIDERFRAPDPAFDKALAGCAEIMLASPPYEIRRCSWQSPSGQ